MGEEREESSVDGISFTGVRRLAVEGEGEVEKEGEEETCLGLEH
jgi:hypothetical protein